MTTIADPAARAQTPRAASEKETVLALLAFQRDTLRWKCSGLTAEQLARPLPPSALTLGGLLKHLAVVEAGWVNLTFAGLVEEPSWWGQYQREKVTEGWAMRTAADDTPEQLFGWLDESQRVTQRVVAEAPDLGALATQPPDGEACSLRWILLHLVQEYGRHLGHVDLIREGIDGTVGI